MHKQEPVLENLLWNFEIQMGHVISARKPDQVIVAKKKKKKKKKKPLYSQLCCSDWSEGKTERKRKEK